MYEQIPIDIEWSDPPICGKPLFSSFSRKFIENGAAERILGIIKANETRSNSNFVHFDVAEQFVKFCESVTKVVHFKKCFFFFCFGRQNSWGFFADVF